MSISRFMSRFKSNSTINVNQLDHDDMSFVNDCIVDQVREHGEYEDPHIRELIYGYFSSLDDDDRTFIVKKHGIRAGMVCCNVDSSTPWDTRMTGCVWMLYVKPEHRDNPLILNQLLYTAVGWLQSRGIKEYTINAASEHLAKKYVSLFDMKIISHEYVMST